MARRHIDFWYEFASTYSFIAAERVAAVAREAGVAVRWRPFLLGPLFAAQGLATSPFVAFPVKGRYMWRDVTRLAARLGHRLTIPDPFPANGLLAARVATLLDGEQRAAFSRAVFRAEFVEGGDIAERAVIERVLAGIGLAPAATLAAALQPDNKATLRAATEEAQRRGLFGAPSFVTEDGELFWGNDRLEDALAWAHGERWRADAAAVSA